MRRNTEKHPYQRSAKQKLTQAVSDIRVQIKFTYMMNFKSLVIIAITGACAAGCSSGQQKDKADTLSSDSTVADSGLNKMRTGNGTGTGPGSSSGSGTGTPGTGTGPGINSEAGSETGSRPKDVPNGTGTDPKKPDTGIKKGKWPTQGKPM